mmetsp:Transcript_44337/g.118309  ORF Transcript_44337/g.118309 Transcript_44337/m.118309 type:complete len:93 (-) Transcript_44337:173-451(-)
MLLLMCARLVTMFMISWTDRIGRSHGTATESRARSDSASTDQGVVNAVALTRFVFVQGSDANTETGVDGLAEVDELADEVEHMLCRKEMCAV